MAKQINKWEFFSSHALAYAFAFQAGLQTWFADQWLDRQFGYKTNDRWIEAMVEGFATYDAETGIITFNEEIK